MTPYTVDRANRALPYVSRIVDDIVETHRKWEEAVVQLDLLGISSSAEDAGQRLAALEKQIQLMARDIDACQAELEQVGVQLKDRRIGLVDFPSEMDGRAVLLCWCLGEASVQYWHELDAGFSGRQPLAPSLV